MRIGLLCGHHIPDLLKHPEKIQIETPYGAITVHSSTMGSHEVFFIHRHGEDSNLPPHQVNHRGNIQAFASCHVSCILSVGTVGSMKKNIKPGDLVIPHDFVDATKSRPQTFYDGARVHVDMSEPFCSSLRDALIHSCTTKGVAFHKKGVCLVTEGPRLETAAEIQLYSHIADIVSMTLVPEVVLAREKGICYASLCLVCNMAAGLQHRLTAEDIAKVYTKKEPLISKVLQGTIQSFDEKLTCGCPVDVSKATL
jgi:5'-methylthioadenosine phosphorylase